MMRSSSRGSRSRTARYAPSDGVDFAARTGSVLGLLGPNGAGKTTAVRILTTLLEADAGTARVAGLDVKRDAAELRAQIGLAGQYAAVDENLTGFENLEMVGRLYHLGKAQSRSGPTSCSSASSSPRRPSGRPRPTPAACAAGSTSPPRSSRGRRCCSSTSPPPGSTRAAGSACGRRSRRRVAAGATVLLTTQYLDEADRLADQIVVIDHGQRDRRGHLATS